MKNLLIITMLLGVGWSQNCSENMSYSLCGSAFECNPSCLNPEGTIWCDNMCYEGCFCNLGYVFSDDNYDTCILLEDCSESWCSGDLSGDNQWNVLDIVYLANCILAENCSSNPNACAGDLNNDGNWDVLDIVILASCVLAGNCDG